MAKKLSKDTQAYRNKLKYIREYNKKSPKLYIQFNYRTEPELIQWLEGRQKATYIKQLIREDMQRHQK